MFRVEATSPSKPGMGSVRLRPSLPISATGGGARQSRIGSQAGLSLVELLVTTGVLAAVLTLTMGSMGTLLQFTAVETTQSNATTTARGAVEAVVRVMRDELVEFNTVAGTPLGVNFDLNNADGTPVVRDGVLFYFDHDHTAQIFEGSTKGQPESAGLDDADGDHNADVTGVGLVVQDIDGDGNQDFIDLNGDHQPDDVDNDGRPDLLWTLTLVRFSSIAAVSTPAAWLAGRPLAVNVYIRTLDPRGPLSGANIATFQFTAHNELAMAYDTADFGGNGDGTCDERELGSLATADRVIDAANEVASIDSVALTLSVVQVARQGLGRASLQRGEVLSDRITPRTLALIRRNGMVGLPDPTKASNIR